MKKSEIKIGTEYAASRFNDYEGRYGTERVVVTGEASTEKSPHYPYSKRTYVPVEVIEDDGTRAPGFRETRHIREEWGPYVVRMAKRKRQALETRLRRSAAQKARAESLLDIIPALRHKGIEDTQSYVYDRETLRLLHEHVPDIILSEDEGVTARIECPLANSIQGYVQGDSPFEVKASDLVAILR